MKRYLVSLALALVVALTPSTVVLGAPSADITITATPSFISISNNETSYDFGLIVASENTSTVADRFNIINLSSVSTDIEISVGSANWTGGDEWYHDDDGNTGDFRAALRAGTGGTNNVIVKYNATHNDLASGLAATTNSTWNLELAAPETFSDAAQKTIVITLLAVEAT